MQIPKLAEIVELSEALAPYIRKTPVLVLGGAETIFLKLEMLQLGGSFKIRGALAQALAISSADRQRGLVAVSGGNHGIAVALVGQLLKVPVRVFLDSQASRFRIERCQSFGAEVVIESSRQAAFESSQKDCQDRGAWFLHPFDHPRTLLAAATLGFELLNQAPDLEVLIAPIGGGGLISGLICTFSQLAPACRVIGVQSARADAMARAIVSGKVERNIDVSPIAFSLCPPQIGTLALDICRKTSTRVVTVQDGDIKSAMHEIFEKTGLMVEGAGSAAWAAYRGPLKQELAGKRVGLIISGSNIEPGEFISR